MTVSLPPRIVELQAIPKIYRRLMASVILKRIAARSASRGQPYVNGQRREELLQDAFAHAWVWLLECELSYEKAEMISPKEAAILAAYRGADRAFDGRPLPGEDWTPSTAKQVPTVELGSNTLALAWDREECDLPPFRMDDLPAELAPLARHLAGGGKAREWADKQGRSEYWVHIRKEQLADRLLELMGR